MARRISPSQLRSQLRQAQNKQRQAINKFNQAVRNYNRGVKSAVDNYNREVRAHNARVRAHRQRIQNELNRLRSRSHSVLTHHATFRVSVQTVHEAYVRYEAAADADPRHSALLDLAEQEDANSLAVMNALLDEEQQSDVLSEDLRQTKITSELSTIAPGIDSRWRGALYALHPGNPDAARHFCTSARELFVQILDVKAPDAEVLAMPSCERTQTGQPTRRSKIRYVLSKKGLATDTLEDFVQQDVQNIIELFGVFNSGTHGPAGAYDLPKLTAIKSRVEDGLLFLARVVS
jgi:hypothetical protein